MELSDSLNSINLTKKNLVRGDSSAEKSYTPFVVMRCLSYDISSIMYVNELNGVGLAEHNVSNLMNYEFLLNIIPKSKKFNKWVKPVKDDLVEIVMELDKLSYQKAVNVVGLLTSEQKKSILKDYQTHRIRS